MDEKVFISFSEAIELNKTETVGFVSVREGAHDETWFPIGFLWKRSIIQLPIHGHTLPNIIGGQWAKYKSK